jgi:hypothetical protein
VKAQNAVAHGAIGIIVVDDPNFERVYPFSKRVRDLARPEFRWLDKQERANDYYPELKCSASLGLTATTKFFAGSTHTAEEVFKPRFSYSSRIMQMAKFFNSGIEQIVYQPAVRNRIGVGSAGTVYTSPAWSMNVVYSRLRPRGILSTFFLNSCLGFFRASCWIFYQYCKRMESSTEVAG